MIVLAVVYFSVRTFNKLKQSPAIRKPEYRYLDEGDRTPEEIVGGRPFHEVKEELEAKRKEELTGNEVLVLWGITKWYEENPYSTNMGSPQS